MSRETKDLTLGRMNFKITQLGAVKARSVYHRFAKAYRSALTSAETEKLVGMADDGTARTGAMLLAIMASLDTAEFDELCETFSECSTVQRGQAKGGPVFVQLSPQVFDDAFAGKYDVLQSWFIAHVLHNGLLPFLVASSSTSPDSQGDPPPTA